MISQTNVGWILYEIVHIDVYDVIKIFTRRFDL